MSFVNRDEAGRRLGHRLVRLGLHDPVVLALPRGGVPVGYRVAGALGAPFDVILVRKLGVPFQPELAMGAVGEEGVRVLEREVVAAAGVTEQELRRVETRERAELERRARRYREGRERLSLRGVPALVVDDGMATGSTARAACLVAKARGARRTVVAVPVASAHAVDRLGEVADEVVVLEVPEPFFAVGQWYLHFDQTSDDDVTALLAAARHIPTGAPSPSPPTDGGVPEAEVDG
ncbi:MAG: hypothetical protein JO368_12460 [Acidimicrobiales bacterium]|nr:hypothetical protein [Acidimicrobiales bacterium]